VLGLSEHTVKTHLQNILDKLQLRSRAHAAAYAVQAGVVKTVHPKR
jgi:DNA-binding CsgD family transcriptional regulator